jgi:hypothetical protein
LIPNAPIVALAVLFGLYTLFAVLRDLWLYSTITRKTDDK